MNGYRIGLWVPNLAAVTCDPHSVNVYIYKWNKTCAKK